MTNLDYLYDKAAAANFFGKNHFVDRKLHFKILERATVLPHKSVYVNGRWTFGLGGLVDSNGEFVKESFVYYGTGGAYTPTEVQCSPASVVYLGLFFPVWGHCITDHIRRLWFLQSDAFKRYFKDCPLVYAPWNNGATFRPIELQENFRRLFELLEVDFDRLQPITQPTQFENVILPDESFFLEGETRFFTDEYRETIERVKSFALKNQTPSPKKIYFFYGRWQIGEERLADYFRSKGYEIFLPENLSLDEQLNVLINAQSFASTLGSCAHNSVFLRDGMEVIVVPRAADKISETSGYQQAIGQLCNLNVTYIDSSLSIFAPDYHGPYCYVLSRQLKEFFGDTFDGYSDDDLKIFAQYLKDSLDCGLAISSDAEIYYGETLREVLTALKRRPDLAASYGVKLS